MGIDMKIKDPKTAELLTSYLDRLKTYPRFDAGQLVRIYADSWGDFCAVESVPFNWCFTSNRHKIADIVQSGIPPIEVPFNEMDIWARRSGLPF